MSAKRPRAPSAYNLFISENYHDIREEIRMLFPRQSAAEINRATFAELAKLWKEQKSTGAKFKKGPPPLPKKPNKIIRPKAEPNVREYFENLLEERRKTPKIHRPPLKKKDLEKHGPRVERLLREFGDEY